jgi:hypothetical protein
MPLGRENMNQSGKCWLSGRERDLAGLIHWPSPARRIHPKNKCSDGRRKMYISPPTNITRPDRKMDNLKE